jgi:hypothetical protein
VWWVIAAVLTVAIVGGSGVVMVASRERFLATEGPSTLHPVSHSPPTRLGVGPEPAIARTGSGGTQFDLKGTPFAKYESESGTARPFPSVANLQTPAGAIVVTRACFSLQAITDDDNKTVQDLRGVGPSERLAGPAVGLRHKLEVQRSSETVAIGITDTRTVRVANVGAGRLLVMRSHLIGPAGKSVKNSPLNGLVLTLAPTEGQAWLFRPETSDRLFARRQTGLSISVQFSRTLAIH